MGMKQADMEKDPLSSALVRVVGTQEQGNEWAMARSPPQTPAWGPHMEV